MSAILFSSSTAAAGGRHAARKKYPRDQALNVARELYAALKPCCERVILAGSLRRRKTLVGDVEILYLPNFAEMQETLFDVIKVNLADAKLQELLLAGTLEKRLNSRGSISSWGPKNKHAIHSATGIPVDLFEGTPANWFNYLVCRTGSAENNILISNSARAKGWNWHPYGDGFTDQEGNAIAVQSEQDVFRLAGLPYLEPWQR
jgi:DNA polymerase/3'-5' exonuclease PolX